MAGFAVGMRGDDGRCEAWAVALPLVLGVGRLAAPMLGGRSCQLVAVAPCAPPGRFLTSRHVGGAHRRPRPWCSLFIVIFLLGVAVWRMSWEWMWQPDASRVQPACLCYVADVLLMPCPGRMLPGEAQSGLWLVVHLLVDSPLRLVRL